MSKLVVLGFGGCQLHGPLNSLGSRGLIEVVYKSMGYAKTPFVFTPRTALQLLGFFRGTIEIPPLVRRLCWASSELEPDAATRALADAADIVLLEPNTPVDILYKGFALSQQEIKKNVEDEAERRYPQLARAVRRWKREGLYKGNEAARRAAADEILRVFKPESTADEVVVDVLREAKGHVATADEIRDGVAALRNAVSGRLALVLYTMQFMPDGRPISWPADFKDAVIAAARDVDLPIYEPATLIAEHGVTTALKDFRHYHDAFKPVAGDDLMIFIDKVAAGARYAPVTAPLDPLPVAGPAPEPAPPAMEQAAPLPEVAAVTVEAVTVEAGAPEAGVVEAGAADPRTVLASARDRLREGRFAEAVQSTESLLGGSHRGAAQKIRALACFKLGRLEEAEAAYREVIAADPADSRAYDNLARILVQTGRGDEATRMLRDAVTLLPGSISLLSQLAALLFAAGHMDETLRIVEAGLAIDPAEERLNRFKDRLARISAKAA